MPTKQFEKNLENSEVKDVLAVSDLSEEDQRAYAEDVARMVRERPVLSFKDEYVAEAIEELETIDNQQLDFAKQGKIIRRWLYIVALLIVNVVVIIAAYYLAKLVQLFRG